MAALEHEAAALAQRGVDRRKRGTQVMVGDQALERVPGHRGEVEAGRPPRVRRRALDPLHIGPPPGPLQRGPVRIQAYQAPAMAVVAGAGQHAAGAAADIKHRVRSHDQLVVEPVAGPQPRIPRVQKVIQRGRVRIGEHRASIRSRPAAINRLTRPGRTPPRAALPFTRSKPARRSRTRSASTPHRLMTTADSAGDRQPQQRVRPGEGVRGGWVLVWEACFRSVVS
jgi:hypothetical protein